MARAESRHATGGEGRGSPWRLSYLYTRKHCIQATKRTRARGDNPPIVGWVLIDSKSVHPSACVVRCPDCPPADESSWESLAASACPVEKACEACGGFLIYL